MHKKAATVGCLWDSNPLWVWTEGWLTEKESMQSRWKYLQMKLCHWATRRKQPSLIPQLRWISIMPKSGRPDSEKYGPYGVVTLAAANCASFWDLKQHPLSNAKTHSPVSTLELSFILPTFLLFVLFLACFLTTHHSCALTHTHTTSCTGQMGALQRQVCISLSSQHAELLFSRPWAYAACSHHYCLYTLSNHYTLW